MDSSMIREQADADANEDRRRRKAILEERYCPECGIEVGPDYEHFTDECCKCKKEFCLHDARFKDTETQEEFVCYECEPNCLSK